jgi:hypothetical protein
VKAAIRAARGGRLAIDVLSQQTGQHGEGTAWDETLQCWTVDSVELVASVHADRPDPSLPLVRRRRDLPGHAMLKDKPPTDTDSHGQSLRGFVLTKGRSVR